MPSLTTPAVIGIEVKIVKEHSSDTKGVVLTHIPRFDGDPVQSNMDDLFWFRSGDEFTKAPYEMIKRLFASSESPDLHVSPVDQLVKLRKDGTWEIPIHVENASSAIGEHVCISVEVLNPSACESISSSGISFQDVSSLNPGKKLFGAHVNSVVYRGMGTIVGNLQVKMKVGKRPRRALRLEIAIFANRMRARTCEMTLYLTKSGFTAKISGERFLY